MNGSGCKTCPVKPCETRYRGSICAARRAELGLDDPLTNADRIQSMPIEALRNLLDTIAYGEAPWIQPFKEKCCDICPTITATIKETGQVLHLNECDFVDGVCHHGNAIMWWLQQPAEEDNT